MKKAVKLNRAVCDRLHRHNKLEKSKYSQIRYNTFMNKSKSIIGGLILLAFITSCKSRKTQSGTQDQAKEYPVLTLTLQNAEVHQVYPAIIKGQEDIDIKPRVDGFIETVLVDEGSVVTKGEPLFKINSPSSVQSLENAQAVYNTARLDVERMKPLADKGIISPVRLHTYENTLASAEATLRQAKATLGWITVTSPVNGIVGTIGYRQGSLVNNSSVLTTIANTTNVVAYFSMNEKDLYEFLRAQKGGTQAEKIKNLPPVKLQLSDGTEYEEEGRIQTISGVVDQTSGAVNFRALFPNQHGLLRSGSSGKVIIPQSMDSVILIPQKATFRQQDKVLVFTVQGDSVMQKTIEAKSTSDGQSYIVTKGLSAGERIVADGIVTLRNGQKIKTK